MKINQSNAMKLWNERIGNREDAVDFSNYQIKKAAYGDQNSEFGWNIHHKQPLAKGGSSDKLNLEIVSIYVNETIGDKTSFVIDDDRFEVHRIAKPEYGIFLIQDDEVKERVDYYE
jgi:hypothetical protein